MQEFGPIFGLLAERGIDPPAARLLSITDVALALGVGRKWVKAQSKADRVAESRHRRAVIAGAQIPRT